MAVSPLDLTPATARMIHAQPTTYLDKFASKSFDRPIMLATLMSGTDSIVDVMRSARVAMDTFICSCELRFHQLSSPHQPPPCQVLNV